MSETRIAPYLCVSPAVEAVAFYKKVFGAVELARSTVPTGEISHCRMRVGEATFYLADPYPRENWAAPSPEAHSVGINLEVDNPRDVIERALAAGATLNREYKQDEYGDWAIVVDPFGHYWTIIRLNEGFAADGVGR